MENIDRVHSKELYEMCVRHFNEPMISHDGIVRCVGYAESAVDCYILTRRKHEYDGKDTLGEIVWNTCVGGYTFLSRLRGQGYVLANNGEEWDDLTRLDSELTLNGCPKEEKFILKIEHDDHENCSREQQHKNTLNYATKQLEKAKIKFDRLQKWVDELNNTSLDKLYGPEHDDTEEIVEKENENRW